MELRWCRGSGGSLLECPKSLDVNKLESQCEYLSLIVLDPVSYLASSSSRGSDVIVAMNILVQ